MNVYEQRDLVASNPLTATIRTLILGFKFTMNQERQIFAELLEITASNDGFVRIMDAASGGILQVLSLPFQTIGPLTVSRDERYLAAPYVENGKILPNIRIWELGTERQFEVMNAHPIWIGALAFSPDSKTLASGSLDGTARLWKLSNLHEPIAEFHGRRMAVNSLSFSSNGARLAVSGDHGETTLWDVVSLQEVLTLIDGNNFVSETFFADDDTLVRGDGFFGAQQPRFSVWRAASNAEVDDFR